MEEGGGWSGQDLAVHVRVRTMLMLLGGWDGAGRDANNDVHLRMMWILAGGWHQRRSKDLSTATGHVLGKRLQT